MLKNILFVGKNLQDNISNSTLFEERWKYLCHFFSFIGAHGDDIGDNGGNYCNI